MAAALALSQMAFVSSSELHSLAVKPHLGRFRLVLTSCPNSLPFASRKHGMVRCDAEDSEAGGLHAAEDQGGKKTIGKLDDLLRNQENNMSKKKKLGFGTKPTSASSVTSPEVKSASTTDDLDFRALLALDGPVLETLSGRLAMFGMASALLGEKATGLTVFEQVFTRGNAGLVFSAGAVQLLTYASLTRITNGRGRGFAEAGAVHSQGGEMEWSCGYGGVCVADGH